MLIALILAKEKHFQFQEKQKRKVMKAFLGMKRRKDKKLAEPV